MYSKESTEKLSSSAKAGAIVILPAKGPLEDALTAVCDGCGAQIWIPSVFEDMLEEGNHRTLCLQCLLTRKVI